MWAGKDSNLRTPERLDLQSSAINHSATYPWNFALQSFRAGRKADRFSTLCAE